MISFIWYKLTYNFLNMNDPGDNLQQPVSAEAKKCNEQKCIDKLWIFCTRLHFLIELNTDFWKLYQKLQHFCRKPQ